MKTIDVKKQAQLIGGATAKKKAPTIYVSPRL